jgi:hypothetical protein
LEINTPCGSVLQGVLFFNEKRGNHFAISEKLRNFANEYAQKKEK